MPASKESRNNTFVTSLNIYVQKLKGKMKFSSGTISERENEKLIELKYLIIETAQEMIEQLVQF